MLEKFTEKLHRNTRSQTELGQRAVSRSILRARRKLAKNKAKGRPLTHGFHIVPSTESGKPQDLFNEKKAT